MDQNGMQEKVTDMSRGKISFIVSRRLSDGRYLTIRRDFVNGGYSAMIHRFLPGGDEEVREDYRDSTADGDPRDVAHYYYKGNRLMRVAARTTSGPQDVLYFYSGSDAPDSLRIYQGRSTEGKLLQRQLFFQNDHGDVLREIVIIGKDTTRLVENSYSYDAKGNWVRRVEIPRKFDPTNFLEKQITVIDREIVY